MPWNGSGTFNRLYSWVSDRIAGIPITASRMDNDTNDIVNGLNDCLTRDGQGFASADLPMAGYKHLVVGHATTRDQYARADQVQDSECIFAGGTGTGDAIAAVFTPAITTLYDGVTLIVTAPGTNTVTNPTFAPNGLTARTITKRGGASLVAGEYASGQRIVLSYSAAGTRWEMVNATPSSATPTGAAGGVLSGTYPNPGFASIAAGTMLANKTASSAAPSAVSIPTQHVQVFTTSGTFTAPTGTTTGTVFKFILTGGGGTQSGYGASGATGIKYVSGLNAGDTVTITIGAAGAGGSSNDGGNTSINTSGTPTAQGGKATTGFAVATNCDISLDGGVGGGGEANIPSYWGAGGLAGSGGAYGCGGHGGYAGRSGVILIEWVL